jgi:hypothetical protein
MPATTRPNEPDIDPKRHLTTHQVSHMVERHSELHYSNTVGFLVARQLDGSRQTLEKCTLDIQLGLIEDRWHKEPNRSINEQIAAMNHPVAQTIANGQSLTLYGDGFFLDIDMSEHNLPIGSTLQINQCTLQVTVEPHNPCSKFRNRFGHPAFKACVTQKHLNLRGVYLKVIHGGTIHIGDPIKVQQPTSE